jgi:hypothetical protein
MPPAPGPDGHRPSHGKLVPMPVQQLLGQLRVQVDANVTAPRMVRERVQRWLVDQHWPADSTADCVMAVSEAVGCASVSQEHRCDRELWSASCWQPRPPPAPRVKSSSDCPLPR